MPRSQSRLCQALFPTASTSDGAIAANVATQAEASAIVALRHNCIHASKPKYPLLRIGYRSSSDAATSKPIRSPCDNAVVHCAVRQFIVGSRRKRSTSVLNAEASTCVCVHAGVPLRAGQRQGFCYRLVVQQHVTAASARSKPEGVAYKVRAGSVRPY
ncbi:hypothetical protein QSH39_020885 [Xanthomonas arboricola pv. corylina]|uniref:hypothetical protein n=1 Tax=Xanthomonas arboricola TaxID=56448 RepID=UPI0011B0C18D|nr:hypothetical protein [Xanthomonas arboricola]MDN0205345.1 hypothetical protein [Xanthomonas arboricola pv. corylina]MDN0207250.1 hypothetical protein [Xanthomonas arboricola pv. corylina]MDN0212740.1 hypothetical protein [Xanthomonas arboricola pv. corylina]MDN0218266.1 hypothetical protein [Xanthomonas arboricola pv. corylina]QUI82655.1 hypothetical protein ICA18_10820 [Xanthomonas arboricola pv. corylina]